ncbi:MAG: IPExxxVDY family protein [Fluviicola sp.]|jgi:hypothetical protein|nr:IPExxxVDY family protein [Fluviicola sp.]
MSKQKRHVLSLEPSIDFEMIGICTHHSDYRLAWGLNQGLSIHLSKCEDLFIVQSKKGAVLSQHSYHFWSDEVNLLEFYLLKNKYEGKFLIPEKSQIDYFLIIRENGLFELEELLENVKQVNSVMAAYIFEAETLPSAELIVF